MKGLRFRRTFKLFPGVRLNISKSGLSTSSGVPGATVNVGKRGVIGTVGVPGTGLSYRKNLFPSGQPSQPQTDPGGANYWSHPQGLIQAPYGQVQGMNVIGSATVDALTSPSLLPLRDMIRDARQQREQIRQDIAEASQELASRLKELRLKGGLLKFIFAKRVAELNALIPSLRKEIIDLNGWTAKTHIDVEFHSSDAAATAFEGLVRAFEACRNSAAVWDITADRATDRIRERSASTRTLERTLVRFEYDSTDLIRFQGRALKLTNANGDDLLLYPGMLVVLRFDGAFALIDIRDVKLIADSTNFIEDEAVPPDSHVAGQVWARANKDGSPDRRFADNYQIPVCRYGRLVLQTATGLHEEFQASREAAALEFGNTFARYQSSL